MEQEHKDELIREESQEQREEAMCIWIKDNISMLKDEFIETLEDEFNDYCREVYFKDGE